MTRQQLLRNRLVALVDALLARHEDKLLPEADATGSMDGDDARIQVQTWEGHRLPSLSADDACAMDEIIDALRRVGVGTYGRCVVCGDAVGFQRLQDYPTTRMCEGCASDEMSRPFSVH
jgi:RNA polymerase-binding transcription factor DksA